MYVFIERERERVEEIKEGNYETSTGGGGRRGDEGGEGGGEEVEVREEEKRWR